MYRTRCLNRDQVCEYSRSARGPGLHNFANASAMSQHIQVSIPSKTKHHPATSSWTQSIPPPLKDGDELQSLHVWSTQICYSFTPTHAPFLRDRVGEQALSCDFLMGALLASSSLHLASDTKDIATARRLVTSSLEHQKLSDCLSAAKLAVAQPTELRRRISHNCIDDDVCVCIVDYACFPCDV